MSSEDTEREFAPGPDQVTVVTNPETIEEGHRVTISGTCSGCPITASASFNGMDLGQVTVTCDENGNWTASITAPTPVDGENNEIHFLITCGSASANATVSVVAL